MLKQALSRSPIFVEQPSILQNEEQQQKEPEDAIKTSLLTQILTSSQRSSNKQEQQAQEVVVAAFQGDPPEEQRFLDETEDAATKKIKKMVMDANNFPLYLQVRAEMEMDHPRKRRGEKKANRSNANCTGECSIY